MSQGLPELGCLPALVQTTIKQKLQDSKRQKLVKRLCFLFISYQMQCHVLLDNTQSFYLSAQNRVLQWSKESLSPQLEETYLVLRANVEKQGLQLTEKTVLLFLKRQGTFYRLVLSTGEREVVSLRKL